LGCAGSAGTGAGSVGVRVVDDEFSSPVVRVPVGGAVAWELRGINPHNVTAADGAWRSQEVLSGRDDFSFRQTFEEPGVFPYYCTFHGTPDGRGMAGVILVGEDAQASLLQERQPAPSEPSGRVLRVGEDYSSIQGAVDEAQPGDLILIEPGIYRESVTVTTPSLVIRGLDRNETILDGGFALHTGIRVVEADAVAVENLTVRNFNLNGVLWTGVTGYRASYVTAANNGDYGIYAFASTDGRIEHSYASGSPDAGFYIGQCYPCRAVIDDVVAAWNALGYSGTNAGGELYIVNSVWRDNMAGIVPNSLDSELNPPHREVTIAGNLVVGNSNREAPVRGLQWAAFGNGILLAGGVGDVVIRNRIVNHDRYGILATLFLDENAYFPQRSEVAQNVVLGSGIADLALAGPTSADNCFQGNGFRTSLPPLLEVFHGCSGGIRLPLQGELSALFGSMGYFIEGALGSFPHNDWRSVRLPPAQPSMPNAELAPGEPATGAFAPPDLEAIEIPEMFEEPPIARQEVIMTGIPVTQPGFWPLLLGVYGSFLPFVLYAAWTALAVWDLAQRFESGSLGKRTVVGWTAAILLLPFVGVIAYHALGRPLLPGWLRATVVGGGLAAYVAVVVLSMGIGGLL
ncbi:MAG: right-handed parallel beta-helix repeat-containing protein, partial [Anaerolineae bacterium]